MAVNEYQWVSDFKVKIASYLKMKIPQSHPKAYVTDKVRICQTLHSLPCTFMLCHLQRLDKTLKHVRLMESQHRTKWM